MTANETKLVEEMKSRTKFSNEEFYTYGRELGLKFKEIGAIKAEHFPKGTKTVAAKKSVVTKATPAKKTPKGPTKPLTDGSTIELTAKQKRALKGADESTGVVQNDDEAFVWIASADEIANPTELHTPNY